MSIKLYINTLFSTSMSYIITLMGGYDKTLEILLIFVAIDYITGVLKAIKTGKLNSYIGFKGISKKVCLFLVIIMANQFDAMLSAPGVVPIDAAPGGIRTAAILFYISNEGLSIVENLSVLGVPLPDGLKRRLKK